MKYLIIDSDGRLLPGDHPYWREILDEVGPEGADRVQLTRSLAAYVNDCGLIAPEKYDRNPVGGALLHALGAPPIPYAGPIVLVGWDDYAGRRGDVEVQGLTDLQIGWITHLYHWLSAILDDTGGSADPVDTGAPAIAAVKAAAAHVSNGDVPPITLYTT